MNCCFLISSLTLDVIPLINFCKFIVKLYLIEILISISLITNDIEIFLHFYQPFLPLWIVCSHPLPISLFTCFFFPYWFLRCRLQNMFLSVSVFLLKFLHVFHFKVLKLIDLFFYNFCILYSVKECFFLKNSLKMFSNYSLMFSPERFAIYFYINLFLQKMVHRDLFLASLPAKYWIIYPSSYCL